MYLVCLYDCIYIFFKNLYCSYYYIISFVTSFSYYEHYSQNTKVDIGGQLKFASDFVKVLELVEIGFARFDSGYLCDDNNK